MRALLEFRADLDICMDNDATGYRISSSVDCVTVEDAFTRWPWPNTVDASYVRSEYGAKPESASRRRSARGPVLLKDA